MNDALWNVNSPMSTQDLVALMKATARRRQETLSDPVALAEADSDPVPVPSRADAAGATQAEVNQTLVQSLELVTRHLENLRAQLGMVEAWVREETERSARSDQEVNAQLSQLFCLVAELSARVDALQDQSMARQPAKWLNRVRSAGLGWLPVRP